MYGTICRALCGAKIWAFLMKNDREIIDVRCRRGVPGGVSFFVRNSDFLFFATSETFLFATLEIN
jgi:hypothetical protein